MSVFDIRSLRTEAGIKQRDLAISAGISLNELAKIERGLSEVGPDVRHRLLAALGAASDLEISGTALSGEGYVTQRPKAGRTVERRLAPTGKNAIVDLFCGVGGFSSGFELTGEFEVVAGLDLLGDRLDTFVTNHPTANAHGADIRQVAAAALVEDAPRPFAIVGGPPCQGFSSIRPFRNVEWDDPRNNLAEEFFRIAATLRPEWIVFENVVGLLTHGKGETAQAIVGALEEIGYRTDYRVLNAASFGVPQRRERLFVVGSLKQKRFRWPEPTHEAGGRSMAGLRYDNPADLFTAEWAPAITVAEAIGDLPPIRSGEVALSYDDNLPASEYARRMRGGLSKLSLHEATAHSAKMLNIIRHAGANIHALPPGMVTSGFSSCYSRLDANEPSVTMTVNFVHPASNRCIHPTQNRALTPREGARLQSFADSFEFRGSRAQIVKQIGNAVPPLLGRAIAQAILESD